MKKLVAYSTRWNLTTRLVKLLANSVFINDDKWETEMYHIEHFKRNGFPKDTSAILSYGILRDTGLAFKEAAKNNIDRYYMDHAYFDAGFKNDCWLRILKNRHTVNYIHAAPSNRWEKFFEKKYFLKPWQTSLKSNHQILIIPPSSAICWYFNAYDWLQNLMNYFETKFGSEFLKKIKIRKKPNEPIVDSKGNFIGLDQETKKDINTLEDDLNQSCLVIAFNSQVALEATIKGIPVIVDKHNCCFSITFEINDITFDLDNPRFKIEPDRLSLMKWLSFCQFNYSEIKSGYAWKTINKYQSDA